MDIKHILKDHAYQNIPLTFDEAYELGVYTIQGCQGDALAQIQSIAALSALHTRATYAWKGTQPFLHRADDLPPSASEQIAGICAAVFEHDIAKSEFGFSVPKIRFAIDNCGMGGDLVVTANVSTIAALIAATAGIPMFKHGSPANADAGRHGSSDFIRLLRIDPLVTKEAMQCCVEETGFGYIEALDTRYKHIHALTHETAKLPHMNDIIGPITSPVHPTILTRKVVGVNHLIPPRVVAEAYRILNQRGITNLKHAFFVRGFVDPGQYRGMDEVSICSGGTQVVELCDGSVEEYLLFANDFGIDSVSPESISPPKGLTKGEFSVQLLNRAHRGNEAYQMIFANAALLFRLAGEVTSFRDGYAVAEFVFQSGLVAKKPRRVSEVLDVVSI